MNDNDRNVNAKRVALTFIFFTFVVFLAVILAIVSTKKMNINKNEERANMKSNSDNKTKNTLYSDEIEVVPTLLDTASLNSAWCATFQLIWNDMQNEVVKKDIEFTPQEEVVENLNKQSFKEENLSSDYYYKIYDLMTKDLKEKIEKEIKSKFDQESDILDAFDWDSAPQDNSGYNDRLNTYFFYTMLYREFNFNKEFSELDNGKFSGVQKQYDNIKYFGIDGDSSEELYSNVKVLYYNSKDDYAVILLTKEGDQVVLARGFDENSNYEEVWNEIFKKAKKYKGKKYFTENDSLKVPNIEFDVLRKYKELENKEFYDYKNNPCHISQALQSIKFSLDKSGGKIKSEAGMSLQFDSAIMEEPEVEKRDFNFDSTFVMFLSEDGKDLPYFGAVIDNITLYQK